MWKGGFVDANSERDGGVRADIRADVTSAQQDFVASLGTAGEWWSGQEFIAVAQATRSATVLADRSPLENAASAGLVDATGVLDDSTLDVVLRVTNHPGTLSAAWYENLDIDSWRYVELVAVVAGLNAVDRFASGVGLEPLALPEADDTEPTRVRSDAEVTTHWVPTTQGPGPNVLRALSAVPSAWERLGQIGASHYVPDALIVSDLTFDHGRLDRHQIELIAAATSLFNECFY